MRLIDADVYCEELIKERDYPNRSEDFKIAIEVAIADLGDMPTIEAEPVKHGKWITGRLCYECSMCRDGYLGMPKTDYCPSCGAKMDLED